jgi:hypothetical protein
MKVIGSWLSHFHVGSSTKMEGINSYLNFVFVFVFVFSFVISFVWFHEAQIFSSFSLIKIIITTLPIFSLMKYVNLLEKKKYACRMKRLFLSVNEFGVENSSMKPVNDVQQTIGSEVGHSNVSMENRATGLV